MARDKNSAYRPYERRDWIFDWKLSVNSTLNSWLAIIVVSGLFALLTLSMRVSIAAPVPGVVEEASILQLGNGRMGKLLAMEAKAKGPFPSRYQPDNALDQNGLGSALTAATQVRAQPHVAHLNPLPAGGETTTRLAARGEPVLPIRPLPAAKAPSPRRPSLMPHLRALSGLSPQELPGPLPAWDELPDERLAAKPWHFMLSIDRNGRVQECIAMVGGGEPGSELIRQWLVGLIFRNLNPTQPSRWIAVAVDFENQPSDHGTQPD